MHCGCGTFFVLSFLRINSSSVFYLWPPCVADVDIIFLLCSFFLLSSFFPRLISAAADWMSTMVRTKATQKWCKNRHLRTIAQLCRAISSQLRHVSTIGKKLIKQQYLPHMSLQYDELQPNSGWDVFVSLGHPSKFQRVSRLGSVTARHSIVVGISQIAALNTGRYLYTAGRPSRWALAHISSFNLCSFISTFSGRLACSFPQLIASWIIL